MIVCDTNILSTFARANILNLLFKLFPKHKFTVPQAVYNEVIDAVRLDFTFLESVVDLVESGQILMSGLTYEEERDKTNLPKSFGPGESEGVVICAHRGGIFLSNDKRVRNYCQSQGIEVYDLTRLLRALWKTKVVSRNKVQKIVEDIERLEKIVFKNKDRIFSK